MAFTRLKASVMTTLSIMKDTRKPQHTSFIGFKRICSKITPQGCIEGIPDKIMLLKMRKQSEKYISQFSQVITSKMAQCKAFNYLMWIQKLSDFAVPCSLLSCVAVSAAHISLCFQEILCGQADWIVPCSSNLLSWLGIDNWMEHDNTV